MKYGEAFLYPPTLSEDSGIRDLPPSSSHLLPLSFPHFCPAHNKNHTAILYGPLQWLQRYHRSNQRGVLRLGMRTRALRIEPEFSRLLRLPPVRTRRRTPLPSPFHSFLLFLPLGPTLFCRFLSQPFLLTPLKAACTGESLCLARPSLLRVKHFKLVN